MTQHAKPVVLFDIDYTLFDTDFFKKSKHSKHKIYEEVIEVLKILKNIATLGIFSEGNLNFQKTKLEKTGIKRYFEQKDTHIVLNKLDELKNILERYKEAKTFFIDDKLSILFDAKNMYPEVFVVWVKRGFYAQRQKKIAGFKPDAEVKNLSEIVGIVQSN